MQNRTPAFAALAAAVLLAFPALAHVNLRYPPTGIMLGAFLIILLRCGRHITRRAESDRQCVRHPTCVYGVAVCARPAPSVGLLRHQSLVLVSVHQVASRALLTVVKLGQRAAQQTHGNPRESEGSRSCNVRGSAVQQPVVS